jgi:N-acyl-D-amino-acid deacylase
MSDRFVIANATIIDGSGAEPFRGDVAIEGDRIARVERRPEGNAASSPPPSPGGPETAVDGSGLTLCPGFIDIHTHADIALLAHPQHEPKLLQGVTTEVFSNCGLGFCPCMSEEALRTQREYLGGLFGDDSGVEWNWRTVGDYLDRLQEREIAVNAAYLFPQGPVRVSVMGMDARTASAAEIERMVALAERSMEEGARGMSSGLWYAPMRYAAYEENVALCRAVAKHGGIWAVHLRQYEEGVTDALREAIRIAEDADVPLQVSHLQANGPANWGRSEEMIEIIEDARSRGADVTADSYPYTAGSTLLQALLPEWANAGGPSVLRDRLRDPADRDRIEAELNAMAAQGYPWETYILSGIPSAKNAALEGRSLAAGAAERNVSPPELLLRLLVEEDLQVCYIRHGAKEGDLRNFLQAPFQMVGSDGLHVKGKPHPRLWSAFPRVLAHYARDERTVLPQEAVRKMTGAPAERIGLKDRGAIRAGAAADLVLLDWSGLRDRATFENPTLAPEGIRAVWVNGRRAMTDGKPSGDMAGRVLLPGNRA